MRKYVAACSSATALARVVLLVPGSPPKTISVGLLSGKVYAMLEPITIALRRVHGAAFHHS